MRPLKKVLLLSTALLILDAHATDPINISGTVTSAKGPEAGVWVIAETTELPTASRASW